MRISDWSSDVCSSDLLTKRGVPVDLIGERVPGKTYCRDADIAQTENIGPLLPKPVDRFIAIGAFLAVGLRMHDWHTVAAIILTGDLAITENTHGTHGPAAPLTPIPIVPYIVIP